MKLPTLKELAEAAKLATVSSGFGAIVMGLAFAGLLWLGFMLAPAVLIASGCFLVTARLLRRWDRLLELRERALEGTIAAGEGKAETQAVLEEIRALKLDLAASRGLRVDSAEYASLVARNARLEEQLAQTQDARRAAEQEKQRLADALGIAQEQLAETQDELAIANEANRMRLHGEAPPMEPGLQPPEQDPGSPATSSRRSRSRK